MGLNNSAIVKLHYDHFIRKNLTKREWIDFAKDSIVWINGWVFFESPTKEWLDSDLIPRLLEIFEKLKTFMIILLNVTNDTYSRILSAWACSRAGILQFEIWKLQTGATTLKNDFFQKVLLSSYRTLKVTSPVRFL